MWKNKIIGVITLIVLLLGGFFSYRLWANLKTIQKEETTSVAKVTPTGVPAVTLTSPAKISDILKITTRDHIRGNRFAKIALIEYGDLECQFCKSFHSTMMQVMNAYPTQVMWVFRHFPLIVHANAEKEAEASECVYDQGGDTVFWQFVDGIFNKTTTGGTGFPLDQLYPLAVGLGLDGKAFQLCLDSGKYAQYISDQENGGVTAGVSGTPGSFIVNLTTGKVESLSGAVPFSQIKPIIDGMLK